eukprot:12707314-Ditylum_brightwellii.AAC.1
MNLYDDLMMLNKFELELLINVTDVSLFHDPNDMINIRCNFYCYKCQKFIGKESGGFSLQEVASNSGEIVYGHCFGKVVVPSSLLYLNKASTHLDGFFKNDLITECKSVTFNKWYRTLFKLKNEDMKYRPMLMKVRSKHTQHFVKGLFQQIGTSQVMGMFKLHAIKKFFVWLYLIEDK